MTEQERKEYNKNYYIKNKEYNYIFCIHNNYIHKLSFYR